MSRPSGESISALALNAFPTAPEGMKMRTRRYSRYTLMIGSTTMRDHFHWKMIQGAIAQKIRTTTPAAEFIEPRATPQAAAVPEAARSSTGRTAIAAIRDPGGTVVGSE